MKEKIKKLIYNKILYINIYILNMTMLVTIMNWIDADSYKYHHCECTDKNANSLYCCLKNQRNHSVIVRNDESLLVKFLTKTKYNLS